MAGLGLVVAFAAGLPTRPPVVRAAETSDLDRRKAAITQACLDYVEGWYLGDAARMRRGVHPQLVKRKLLLGTDGTPRFRETTLDGLLASSKPRALAPGAVQVEILGVLENTATVRIVSPGFVDFAHLVRWDGAWLVTNVAWE